MVAGSKTRIRSLPCSMAAQRSQRSQHCSHLTRKLESDHDIQAVPLPSLHHVSGVMSESRAVCVHQSIRLRVPEGCRRCQLKAKLASAPPTMATLLSATALFGRNAAAW